MKRTPILAAGLLCIAALSAGAYAPAGQNIKTRWASEVNPSNAHAEYPRPQMVRADWQNLNGLWDYAVTPLGAEAVPAEADGQILVPFCIESSLSGVCSKVGRDSLLWYRTQIQAPGKWAGKKILLHFDAVDWDARIFINGEQVGSHTGGYTAFTIDVTEYLQDGPAELVVRVWDPSDDREFNIPHGKQVVSPRSVWYTSVTGIWQSVWMEAVNAGGYITDYNVVSDIDNGTILVSPVIDGAQEGDEVKVEVLRARIGYNPEKPACGLFKKGSTTVKAGEDALVSIRNPRLWSTEKPWLYGLRISLIRDSKVIDRVNAYTALRKVGMKDDGSGTLRFTLNDSIIFHYGPLDQGWWPDGLYTAPTAEALEYDIRKTKDFGFNMIRKHIKIEPSRWYYDCDKLGIMVWQDMPSVQLYPDRSYWAQDADEWGAGKDGDVTQEQKDNYYKEWTEIIAQLRKFPSIAVWVPFNEGWGQFDTQYTVDFTRNLDPTRLINPASGGNWIKGAGDIVDSHYYPNPVMRILDEQKVNVLGEYGGIGRPIEGHLWEIGKKWGYVQMDSEQKATDTYVLYTKDLVLIKQTDKCAGAVYTQTTDVEGEINGLMTYDREIVKFNEKKIREANEAVIAAPLEGELDLVSPFAFHYRDKEAGAWRHLQLYTIRGGGLTMQVTDFGARVISLFAPDKDGNYDDIIVGYDDAKRFVHNTGERFLGATVGRVANRIGGGRFTLDGKTYTLPRNNNGQTLHGGLKGMDMIIWKMKERTDSSITFTCKLNDGMDGFPGNLSTALTYTLTSEGAFDIRYEATTDKATPVNLSNHAFYNLKGRQGGTILDHKIQIDADHITPVDKVLIPTGELMPVEGTPFDFREPHLIGERVEEQHEQLLAGGGYDHNWVLNAPCDGLLHKVCVLSEETTGRVMEIFTDQPGLQFYCGNFFFGEYPGKTPQPIGFREALALETQKFPDGINKPDFPNTVLRPGETYTQHTVYKFSAR